METLLLDRSAGRIDATEFTRTVLESNYSSLRQQLRRNCFPPDCHGGASVNCLSLESDQGQYLLSGCGDSSIKLWDVANQTPYTSDADWNADLDLAPISTYSQIAVIPRKSTHQFGISAIQWWPFDTGLFVSSSFDHTVKVWDTESLLPVHSFDLKCKVYAIDICGDDNAAGQQSLVAVGSDQPFIRLLDLRSASSAHTLQGHKQRTLCVKWHPQNPYILCSGGYDGECKIWDVRRSKSCLTRLDMLKTNTAYDASDNLTRASVKAHLAPVNGLAWDNLGTGLYTAGNDDKIRVWDLVSSPMPPPTNMLVNFGPLTRNKYPQNVPIILSPCGETELQQLLFPSDNGDVFVFRTIDGKLISRLSRTGPQRASRTVSMCSAGAYLSSYFCGTNDGQIIHWSPGSV